jgi:hypothetical protein
LARSTVCGTGWASEDWTAKIGKDNNAAMTVRDLTLLENFCVNMDHSLLDHIEYFGGAGRDIENATARKRSSVVYRYNDTPARFRITHANARPKWQRAMCGSECAALDFLPAGRFASFIRVE